MFAYGANVFAYDGQGWFKKHEIVFRGKIFQFAGIHNLGINYSLFMKSLLVKTCSDFSYSLVKDMIKEDRVFVEFQRQLSI